MPSLVALAEQLLAQARHVDEVLARNKIPCTSFDRDTLELIPENEQKLRWDLLDTTHNLRQLLRGAKLGGLDIAFSWTEQAVLRTIWRYKLASSIPLDGSATYRDISTTSGLRESLVIRTVRAAIPLNIFDEPSPGFVRHTAISRLLATDEGYYESIGLQLQDLSPASLRLIESWEADGDDAGTPEQSAFSLQNGGRSLFAVLANDPERAHRFNMAMKYSVGDKNMNLYAIVEAFDWSNLDKPGSQLIDLGGGFGQVSQTLAQNTHHLAFVVQDLAHVVEQGEKNLPQEFAERITFETHDFMEAQRPRIETAVSFLISRCLHNWSDYQSSRILRSLTPRLQYGSKILIWDSIIDDKPVKKLSEKFNLQQDFIMATITNGKDRTVDEFRHVLKLSDERFVIDSIQKPRGSNLGLIQVSWNG